AAVYIVSAVADLGFIPGMIPAFPVILGLALARPRDEAATVVMIAVGSLPLVWAFQFLGAAGPQWGGRYMLPSAMLLATVALGSLAQHPEALRALTGLALAVTILGVGWMAVRTRSVDSLFTDLRRV